MGKKTCPSAKQHLNISYDLIRLPFITWPWPNLQVQRKENNPLPRGHIQRSKLPSCLHWLMPLRRDARCWERQLCLGEKRGKELTHCSWWVCKDLKWTEQILLANGTWFPGKLRHPLWWDQALSADRSNASQHFAEVGIWYKRVWMVVILPLSSQWLVPDTSRVLTDMFTNHKKTPTLVYQAMILV